jgi:sugar (pentulose or hexulose) kinase
MQADRFDGPLTIGIDLGTQSVRVVLLEEHGMVAASGSAPLSSIRTEGVRHEQDPEAWWEAVGEAAREATGELGDREVSGLAICSTSETFLLADEGGRPLTPALMYNDGRAEEEARLAQDAGEEVWSSLGTRMQRSFALPKLLWVLRSGLPEVTARFMHQADFVASRLAGEPVATDWSHALKTGYDLVNGRWPEEVLEQLEVPVEILPPVVRPGSTIGEVSENAASHTGFPADTPIRAGMTDGCAAQIAAGALKEGQWNSVLGTTLALKGVARELLRDPTGAVYCHKHPDGGWLPGGASNTGAGVISEKFPKRDLEELGEKAARHGPSTMVVYPLTTEGERFPFANSEARGFEIGEPEDETDLYQAILEGVAFVERLCFVHLESIGAEVSGPVALTGGGAKSRVWSQLRADVLGLPVVVSRSSEGAIGMAILARAGDGSVADTAANMSGAVACFEPDEDRDGSLAENFDRLATAFVERGYISEDLAKRARMS